MPNVEATPEFADPTDVLAADGVTIAGPEVPVDGSAERLFETISDDPGATLVQLINGGSSPVTSAACTTHQFSLSNHPSPETIDGVVEALSPVHVVITHQQGAAADQYKDKYDSFVWATDNTDCYTLLDESGWTPPPWVTESTTRRVQAGTNTSGRLLGDAVGDVEMPLPNVRRVDDIDLGAEGLDLERLRDRLPTGRVGQTPDGLSVDQQDDDDSTATTDSVRADVMSGEWPGTTDEPDIETALTSLDARLERIETAVTERGIDARVVDAGDDALLLRLDNPPEHLEHGQRLRVLLQDGVVSENAVGQADRER